MRWPVYPTYLERILLAQRAIAPRVGSTIGPVTLSGRIEQSAVFKLAPGSLPLVLELDIPAGVTFTVQGATAVTEQGTISAVTPTNPATSTRGTITNTGGDPAFVDAQRLRLISGANTGALAWVTGLVAANQARVNRWGSVNPAASTNPAIIEPAIGNAYAVDTLQTTLTNVQLRVRGEGRLLIRDCIIATPGAVRLVNDQVSTGGVYFYACRVAGAFAFFYDGEAAYVSSQFESPVSFSNTLATIRNSVFRSNVDLVVGALTNFARSCCFRSKLTVRQGLIQFTGTPGDMQFVDQPAGDFAIDVQMGGGVDADIGAVAWGADNGAMSAAIHVRSGASYTYADATAKPTIPGGVADVNLGGTTFAYAAIPAVNATNLAQMVVEA